MYTQGYKDIWIYNNIEINNVLSVSNINNIYVFGPTVN